MLELEFFLEFGTFSAAATAAAEEKALCLSITVRHLRLNEIGICTTTTIAITITIDTILALDG